MEQQRAEEYFLLVKDCVQCSFDATPPTDDANRGKNNSSSKTSHHPYGQPISFQVDPELRANGSPELRAISIIGAKPIHPSLGIFYYEITIQSDDRERGEGGEREAFNFGAGLSMGISNSFLKTDELPGEHRFSYGFFPALRRIHCGGRASDSYGEKVTIKPGVSLGCLVNFFDNSISFTVNGRSHGVAFRGINIRHRCSASRTTVKQSALHLALGLQKPRPGATFTLKVASGEDLSGATSFAFDITRYVRGFVQKNLALKLKAGIASVKADSRNRSEAAIGKSGVATAGGGDAKKGTSGRKPELNQLILAHLVKRGFHKTLSVVNAKLHRNQPPPAASMLGPTAAQQEKQKEEEERSLLQQRMMQCLAETVAQIREHVFCGMVQNVPDLLLSLDPNFLHRYPRLRFLLQLHHVIEDIFTVFSSSGRKSQELAARALQDVTNLMSDEVLDTAPYRALLWHANRRSYMASTNFHPTDGGGGEEHDDDVMIEDEDEAEDAKPRRRKSKNGDHEEEEAVLVAEARAENDGHYGDEYDEDALMCPVEDPVPYKQRSQCANRLSTVLLTWKNTVVDGSTFGTDVVSPLRFALWTIIHQRLLMGLPEFTALLTPAEVNVYGRRCVALVQEDSELAVGVAAVVHRNAIPTSGLGLFDDSHPQFRCPYLNKVWETYLDDGECA